GAGIQLDHHPGRAAHGHRIVHQAAAGSQPHGARGDAQRPEHEHEGEGGGDLPGRGDAGEVAQHPQHQAQPEHDEAAPGGPQDGARARGHVCGVLRSTWSMRSVALAPRERACGVRCMRWRHTGMITEAMSCGETKVRAASAAFAFAARTRCTAARGEAPRVTCGWERVAAARRTTYSRISGEAYTARTAWMWAAIRSGVVRSTTASITSRSPSGIGPVWAASIRASAPASG